MQAFVSWAICHTPTSQYIYMYIYVPILIAERESLSFNKSQNMGLSINGLPSISQGLQSW